MSTLLKRLEFHRLKFRNPHLADAIIDAFMDFCELLSVNSLNIEKLNLLLRQIPGFLIQFEGGSIMDILRNIDLVMLTETAENAETLRLILSLIKPNDSDKQLPGQYYNNQYVLQHYQEISNLINRSLYKAEASSSMSCSSIPK